MSCLYMFLEKKDLFHFYELKDSKQTLINAKENNDKQNKEKKILSIQIKSLLWVPNK